MRNANAEPEKRHYYASIDFHAKRCKLSSLQDRLATRKHALGNIKGGAGQESISLFFPFLTP